MKKIRNVVLMVTFSVLIVFLNNGSVQAHSSEHWPKRVLITNDNGIDDLRIAELAQAFAKIAETYVVASIEDRSGSIHYFTSLSGTVRSS